MDSLWTFLAVVAAVMAVYSIVSDVFFRDSSRIKERLSQEFRKETREKLKASKLFKEDAIKLPDGAKAKETLTQQLDTMLQQAGMNLTPAQLLQIVAMAAIGLGVVAAAVTIGLMELELLLAGPVIGAFAILGAWLPFVYVQFIRNRRQEKILAQMPDVFELMARIIRAGQTMPQAMSAVATEFDQPISAEFAICSEQQSLGISVDDSVRDLSNRTNLIEMKIFATAIIVQRQTGGNMAELLNNLSEIVRERFRIRELIKTMTAESRMQALMLIGLPIFLLVLFSIIKPTYMEPIYEYPGYYLLVVLFISELIGWLIIRKIVNFEY